MNCMFGNMLTRSATGSLRFLAIVMLENAWGAKNFKCPLHLQSHKV